MSKILIFGQVPLAARPLSVQSQHSSSFDLEPALNEEANRFRKGFALVFEDASGERFGCIAVENGSGALQDDRPVVEFIVGKVDGAAGDLHARGQGRLVDVVTVVALAAKGGDQRGVDVDHLVREIFRNGEQLQKAGQANQVGLCRPDTIEDRLAKSGPGAGFFFGDDNGGQPCPFCSLDALHAGVAGNDENDLRIEPAIANAIDEVLQRRAPGANQDGKANGGCANR